MSSTAEPKLLNRNFLSACIANYLYFFGFYSLLPILALYLIDTFQSGRTEIGVVLSCYTIAALVFRPFAGFLVDRVPRKKLYISALTLFVSVFAGYPFVTAVALFAFLRAVHGLAFGALTVSANTLVIDITPSERRGSALGYYGIANSLAMATGPLLSVYVHDHLGYNYVFAIAFCTSLVALIIGSTISVPVKKIDAKVSNPPISLDRFILLKGLPAGLNLFLMAIPYGMITSFIALYSQELGLGSGTGSFFLCMAFGIILSRTFSGKQVDRGSLTHVLFYGMLICILAITLLATAYFGTSNLLRKMLFNLSAVCVGLGYGAIFPAMNTLLVNLAHHNQRGTANATYMTTWDVGIGAGMLIGGAVGEISNYSIVFYIGAVANVLSLIFYQLYSKEHYLRNKLDE